jgi:hypothetical protein
MAGKKKASKPKEEKVKEATAKKDKEEAPPKKASSKKEKDVAAAKKAEENAATEKEKVEAPAKKDEKAAAKKRKDEAPAKKDDEAPAKKGKVEAPAKKDEEVSGKKDDKAPAEKQEEPATNEQTKEETPAPPSLSSELAPSDRDVILVQEKDRKISLLHRGNLLLTDLIRIHYLMSPIEKRDPKEEKDVEELATRLTQLMLHGKKFELAGLKDVPKPFLKGEGHFYEKKDKTWKKFSEEEAKAFVAKTILSEFKTLGAEKSDDPEMNEEVAVLVQAHSSGAKTESEDETTHAAPRPFDVLFLPVDFPVDDSMPYEHQTGNKHTLFLASQHVASDTDTSQKRIAAALKVVTSKVEINSGTDLIQRRPRPIIQLLVENQNSWQEMERMDLGEFAVIFVFEVYLEKQIHHPAGSAAASSSGGNVSTNGDEAVILVENPTTFDVLFVSVIDVLLLLLSSRAYQFVLSISRDVAV